MPAPLRSNTLDSLNPASPFARRYSGIPLPIRVLSEGVESFVASQLTSSLEGHLAIEEGLPKSFSHLYLASNYVSIDALSRLLNRPDLQHLDAGSLSLSQSHDMLSPSSASTRLSNPPEVESLSPALFIHAFRNLRSLRMHYSVITSCPFSGTELAITAQCFELHGEDLRYELDSTQFLKPGTFFELEDTSLNITPEPEKSPGLTSETESHATFESPDDVGAKLNTSAPIEINGSSSIGPTQKDHRKNNIQNKTVPPQISVSSDINHVSEDHIVSPINTVPDGPERFKYNYVAAPERHWQEALNRPRPATIRELIEEVVQRKHRIEVRERHPGRFKPSMLPNLRTLTLTDVPSTTRRRSVTDSLITFIQECAEEEELVRLEERARHQAGNQYSHQTDTLKLEHLTLEMTSLPDPILPSRSSQHAPHNKRHSFTKSSTEDADSETFMEKSETDFTFFGEDDGDLLVSEGRIDAPIHFDEGMILEVDDGHLIDVVSVLASFRREKRKRFEAAMRFEGDKAETALLGHWRGEIKVMKGVKG